MPKGLEQTDYFPELGLQDILGTKMWAGLDLRSQVFNARTVLPPLVEIQSPTARLEGILAQGEVLDLVGFVVKGRQVKEEHKQALATKGQAETAAQEALRNLMELYQSSEGLMNEVVPILREQWELTREAETYIADSPVLTAEYKPIIAANRWFLKEVWRRVWLPPKIFAGVSAAYSEEGSATTPLTQGEVIALLLAPHPAEGFLCDEFAQAVEFAHDVLPNKEREKIPLEATRSYIRDLRSDFVNYILKYSKRNLRQTVGEFIMEMESQTSGERRLPWEIKTLKEMKDWEFRTGEKTFRYEQMSLDQFIHGVVYRFRRPFNWETGAWEPSREEVARRQGLQKFSPQGFDMLAEVVVRKRGVIPLAGTALVFSDDAKTWASERIGDPGYSRRTERRTKEVDQHLFTRLVHLAQQPREKILDYFKAVRRHTSPVLREILAYVIRHRIPPERIETLMADILGIRIPEKAKVEKIGEKKERRKRPKKETPKIDNPGVLEEILKGYLQQMYTKAKAARLEIPNDELSIFQFYRLVSRMTLDKQAMLVKTFGLPTEIEDGHPRYTWETALKLRLAQKFQGKVGTDVLKRALNLITGDLVARLRQEVAIASGTGTL